MAYGEGYAGGYADAAGFTSLPGITVVEPQELRWHVCDSLTGNIVGRLSPVSYEITEEIRASTVGTLTLAMPDSVAGVGRLNTLIRPGDRSPTGRAIAMEDASSGTILFYGPIIRTPQRSGPTLTLDVNDWSAWFRTAVLRPIGTKFVTKRDYVVTNKDQGLIMRELFQRALGVESGGNPTGKPSIVVDASEPLSKNRDRTVRMFSRIGEHLDELAATDAGIEWHTYGTRNSHGTQITGHVTADWPERGTGKTPHRLSWKQDLQGNISGNISSYDWPGGENVPTRVWATDGNEEAALWGYDQSTTLGSTDILWEDLIDLADGTTDKATATARAKGELKRATAFDGLLELTVDVSKIAFHAIVVGERARVEIDDSWNRTISTNAARIIRRVMSGGYGKPTVQVLTVDIDDNRFPWGVVPGTGVG